MRNTNSLGQSLPIFAFCIFQLVAFCRYTANADDLGDLINADDSQRSNVLEKCRQLQKGNRPLSQECKDAFSSEDFMSNAKLTSRKREFCGDSGTRIKPSLPMQELVDPEQASGDRARVRDSHQSQVKISVLTEDEAKQFVQSLQGRSSEMGSTNLEADNKLCAARAQMIDCFADMDCSVTTGRVYLTPPLMGDSNFTVNGKNYLWKFHTANLIYIKDKTGTVRLHVIDHFASGAKTATGALTPIPYEDWKKRFSGLGGLTGKQIQFYPRYTASSRRDQSDIGAKCALGDAQATVRAAQQEHAIFRSNGGVR